MRKATLFWGIMFFIFVAATMFMTGISVTSYFMMPSTKVSIELPANVWIAFIFSGLGREWVMGFFTYFSYVQWRKAKETV